MPDPVAGYEPRSYPEPPEEFTKSSAEKFASTYEGAIGYNEFLARNVFEDTVQFSFGTRVDSDLTESVGSGYLIGVSWFASTEAEDGQIADWAGVVVYYIAPNVGVRAGEVGELAEDESLGDFEYSNLKTVYCR